MKRTCPEYPLFLIETPKTGTNCSAYWIQESFGKIEFLGTVPYSQVLSDNAFENLLELSIDDDLHVFLGGTITEGVLYGGTCIGTLYKKGDHYWHHVFAAEKRLTISAAARAMYKKLRLHRTSVGDRVVTEMQLRRNF